MLKRGMRPIVLSEREELSPEAAPIFRAYFDIDRDGFSGRLQFRGMCAVLDEMGIVDRAERQRWRGFWRAMQSREQEIQEERRKREEEKKGMDEAAGRVIKRGRKGRKAERVDG